MFYKCFSCGHIFEDGEMCGWNENRGQFWGTQCSESMSGCPLCGDNYEETEPCQVCGSQHFLHELNGGVCKECIDEYRNDFDACYDLCLCETQEIKINALLASLFEPSDIEQILKQYIKDKWKDVSYDKFIDEDLSWFGERLAEEVKKNEC